MQWVYGRSAFVRYVITKFCCFHRLRISLSNGAPPRSLRSSGSSVEIIKIIALFFFFLHILNFLSTTDFKWQSNVFVVFSFKRFSRFSSDSLAERKTGGRHVTLKVHARSWLPLQRINILSDAGANCSIFGCGMSRKPKYEGIGIFKIPPSHNNNNNNNNKKNK